MVEHPDNWVCLKCEQRRMKHNKVCVVCGHGMLLHGSVDGHGYCSEGNGDWCECIEEGLTYEQEINEAK